MNKFKTLEISGIEAALRWMRYPMGSTGDTDVFGIGEKDRALAIKLASAKAGSGHDCFLKSIVVHFDVTAGHAWYLQALRYHFWDISSSTSKMHSVIRDGGIDGKTSKWIGNTTKELISSLVDAYVMYDDLRASDSYELFFEDMDVPIAEDKSELFECIIDNMPLGYELTAGWTSNYLQLKTVYAQRKNHKLSVWNTDFVEWVHSLPMSYLITGDE